MVKAAVNQAKLSNTEAHTESPAQRGSHGFKDKSEVVQTALDHLLSELIKQRLIESAELYAEVYENDHELKDWADQPLSDWPE